MDNINFITIALIAANVMVSLKGFNDYSFFERYKFNVGAIRKGEQLRLFSSGFLHVDTAHLALNMFTLYIFADLVINYVGVIHFLIIYVISLLAGSLIALYFHKNEFHYSAVGASGAVTGIVYSAILLEPSLNLSLFFIPLPIPAYIFGVGYLMYTIYGIKSRAGNIGHDAHFGGAIGGYLVTMILASRIVLDNLLMPVLLAIPIILLFILKRLGKL